MIIAFRIYTYLDYVQRPYLSFYAKAAITYYHSFVHYKLISENKNNTVEKPYFFLNVWFSSTFEVKKT